MAEVEPLHLVGLGEFAGVADLAYVLDVGKVSLSGPAAELARTDEVQRLYLGHGDAAETGPATRGPRRTLSRWTA